MLQGSRWMATIILAFQAIGVVYGASLARVRAFVCRVYTQLPAVLVAVLCCAMP